MMVCEYVNYILFDEINNSAYSQELNLLSRNPQMVSSFATASSHIPRLKVCRRHQQSFAHALVFFGAMWAQYESPFSYANAYMSCQ